MQNINTGAEKPCHTQVVSLYPPPPKNLNKNRQLETPSKRPAPARRFLRAVVSSLLLGGLVLGWPGTGGAQTQTCTRGDPPATVTGDLATDCNTLLNLKAALRGTLAMGATDPLNWVNTLDMDSWTGVTVSGTPPRVTSLSLPNKSLTGTLPAALNSLTGLQSLTLFNNQLTGSIPALSALTALQILHLGSNRLTGSIPALSALEDLQTLHLSSNQLTGRIPVLSALTALRNLHLHSNRLTGEIRDLSALRALQQLYLHDNQLSGRIPDLSALRALRILYLQNNQLTGPIPDLSALTALKWLWLQNNQLTGRVPDLRA